MKKNNILISIIVPIYNVEQYLDRCVESIVNQTYKNIEILLIDDGATDSSGAMCDKWSNIDKRIKVIHKKNGGLSDARNTGLLESNGDYIMFIDSDDYIELDSCEKFVDVLTEDVDFIVGNIREVREDKVVYQKQNCFESGTIVDNKTAIISLIDDFSWFAPAPMKLYNRNFLLSNNLMFVKGIYYEDLEFLPRVYLAANKVGFLNYDFYNYIIRDNSITTSKKNDKKASDTIFILNNWKILFDNVSDKELKHKLYGNLVKIYLRCCRDHKYIGWKVNGLSFKFAFKYALNIKEKLKVLYFKLFPNLYIK